MTDYEGYLSSFTWRYGSEQMRRIWSEVHKRRMWREMWVALAEAQAQFDLIGPEIVADLRAHADQVDVPLALEIEAEIHHDLVAELQVFAGQCPLGGGSLHLGATSMDIEDNADVLRVRQSLDLLLAGLDSLLLVFAGQIERWSDKVVMAYTHLQPAEPTTLGYRLALYAQDLLLDWEEIRRARRRLRGKGFRGAVGTGAAFAELIGGENLAAFEAQLSTRLGLPFYPVTGQTYPRKQDYGVISALAGLGGSLHKFAFDLRILQSPAIGEVSEPFGTRQVGSSAMPFKRNPIGAERIDSLARQLAQMPRLAWDNAAHSLLERTLDDSANRRSLLPEAFLICDELLLTAERIVAGLQLDEGAIQRNLLAYGSFAGTERILMAASKAGADRRIVHERLRMHSLAAWESLRAGGQDSLVERLCQDEDLLKYLSKSEMRSLMNVGGHIGDAVERALSLAQNLRQAVTLPQS